MSYPFSTTPLQSLFDPWSPFYQYPVYRYPCYSPTPSVAQSTDLPTYHTYTHQSHLLNSTTGQSHLLNSATGQHSQFAYIAPGTVMQRPTFQFSASSCIYTLSKHEFATWKIELQDKILLPVISCYYTMFMFPKFVYPN